MVKLDNPVRLSRLASRLSQKSLATRAGIARMTLVGIEEGTTRDPDVETVTAIAQVLGDDPRLLRMALQRWQADQPQFRYPASTIMLAVEQATTFQDFRLLLEPSVTRFAEKLGVARGTLANFERGKRREGMPDSIASGLLAIGVPRSALVTLQQLPVSPDQKSEG